MPSSKTGSAPDDKTCDQAWTDIMKIASDHALIFQAYGGTAILASAASQRRSRIRNDMLAKEVMKKKPDPAERSPTGHPWRPEPSAKACAAAWARQQKRELQTRHLNHWAHPSTHVHTRLNSGSRLPIASHDLRRAYFDAPVCSQPSQKPRTVVFGPFQGKKGVPGHPKTACTARIPVSSVIPRGSSPAIIVPFR